MCSADRTHPSPTLETWGTRAVSIKAGAFSKTGSRTGRRQPSRDHEKADETKNLSNSTAQALLADRNISPWSVPYPSTALRGGAPRVLLALRFAVVQPPVEGLAFGAVRRDHRTRAELDPFSQEWRTQTQL